MLKTITYLLLIASLLLGCQPNVPKEEQFYKLLRQELIERNVLLLEGSSNPKINCYEIKSFLDVEPVKQGQRVPLCEDSLVLLRLGFEGQEIQQFVERAIDTTFLWETFMEDVVINATDIKQAGISPTIRGIDTFYSIPERIRGKVLLDIGKPYFSTTSNSVLVLEKNYLSERVEQNIVFKKYVYQKGKWALQDTVHKSTYWHRPSWFSKEFSSSELLKDTLSK